MDVVYTLDTNFMHFQHIFIDEIALQTIKHWKQFKKKDRSTRTRD
jgi:hypothetical protein